MKKVLSFVLSAVMALSMTACSDGGINTNTELVDGTYRAEFLDFDTYGWKDYVEVTIVDGQLNEVVYDSVDKDNELKSEDMSYKADMEAIVGTYPAKYNRDLINQFIQSGKVTSVDIVAGATESTGKFKTLIVAAMQSAVSGESEVKVVENLK